MKAKIRLLGNLLVSETARNTYAVFIGNAVSAVLAFIFTVTLVRRLTLSDFGYFSALLSFMLLLTELSDIGIGQSLSSFLPRLEKTVSALHSFLKASFVIQLAISSVVSFTIIIFSLTVSRLLFHTDKFAGLVILTAIGIYATVLSNFVNNSLSARKKFLKVAFLTVFGAFLRLALLIVIILFSVVTLNNSVLVQSLSLVILMLAALSVHKFSFLQFQNLQKEYQEDNEF
ncbi:MAG: Polysaccharide biosynthesis protein [Microgenomates group bacterium GW2011_GWC1_37_12b]|nr:MAG: Polysaccharide biosynthesis protein [Microgenomates group bacterium GW2011_GWC1_37_12b]